MTDEQAPEQGELEILRAGDRLRMAREGAGLTIADIAARTRITQRHIDAIERSDFDALPGRTYIAGFARSYARALGISEADIAREIRAELDSGTLRPREPYEAYEPADPDRVPSRRLAWTMFGFVAILAIAYGIWRTLALDTTVEPASTSIASAGDAQDDAAASAVKQSAQATPSAAAGAVPANARVVLAVPPDSRSNVWVGFDNAEGVSENYRTLDPGEELVVPPDYLEKFTLRTANPQFLRITVDGRDVGPIGPAGTMVKNVSLKPGDLLARGRNVAAQQEPPATTTRSR